MRSNKVDYQTNGHVATVEEIATAGVAPSPGAAALVKKGIAAAQKGDRDAARSWLTQATEVDPATEDAWMWLASISEYPEELLAFLNNVLAINPENQRAAEWQAATRSLLAKTLVQRGVAAHEEGNEDLASSCFDDALGHDNDFVLGWLWKARVAASDDKKVEFLERVLELDPENEEALQAIAPFREPTPEQRFEEAKWAAVAGRRSEAMQLLDEVLDKNVQNAEAWILKSHFSLDLNEKLAALEQALEIDPDNFAARAGYDFLRSTVNGAQAHAEHVAEESSCDAVAEPVAEAVEADPSDVDDEPVAELESPIETAETEPETAIEIYESEAESMDEETNDVMKDTTTPDIGSPELVDEAAAEVYENSPFDEVAIDAIPEEAAEDRSAEELFCDAVMEADPAAETAESMDVSEWAETIDDEQLNEPVDEKESPLPEPAPEFVAEEAVEDYFDEAPEILEEASIEEYADEPQVVEAFDSMCAFCEAPVDSQAFECGSCHAVLTLSDIESLLANSQADRSAIEQSVMKMEADWNSREFSVHELTVLGIGYFNLRNFDQGFRYLQEASRLEPNNVILSGQVNSLAIRLDEIRRQEEIDGSKPKGKTILVVDDSATVRKLISAKLEKSGHNVTCAADGVEGLERLSDGMPDLVLLDISMPRMDGYEVCKQIRANPAAAGVPVVMISGKDGFFDKVRGKMAGCTGYVTKPFGPETLMKALETYLLPENGHAE
jgi:twitching motility two-component system response regulator PilG